MSEAIYCHDTQRKVRAGELDENNVFHKYLKDIHLLQFPKGIAIQTSVLKDLRRRGCTEIHAHLIDLGRVLRTSLLAFRRHGWRFNRGYGEQTALVMKYWENLSSGQLCLGNVERSNTNV